MSARTNLKAHMYMWNIYQHIYIYVYICMSTYCACIYRYPQMYLDICDHFTDKCNYINVNTIMFFTYLSYIYICLYTYTYIYTCIGMP